MNALRIICAVICLFSASALEVFALEQTSVPSSLSEWKGWVMHGEEKHACPTLYNDSGSNICIWPERLDIKISRNEGIFSQVITVMAPDTPVILPGDINTWPIDVTVNKKPFPVVPKDRLPSLILPRGTYRIHGRFIWDQPPGHLPVPDITGQIRLTVNGETQNTPYRDDNNRLWIDRSETQQKAMVQKKIVSRMDVRIFRKITDQNPMTVETRLRLMVSGDTRRVRLKNVLIPDTIPMDIKASLPTKLDTDGTLWVEVKAGKWDLTVKSLFPKPPVSIGPVPASYGPEVWAFEFHPDLRTLRVEGVPAADPSQTTLPREWKKLTSYTVSDGETVTLQEIRRGSDPKAGDALTLNRDFWLDFDGNGAVVRDSITGSMARRYFLGMDTSHYKLGRVTLDGQDQLVVKYNDQSSGIELIRGPINMKAVSRVENISSGMALPLGWNDQFQNARGRLHLPPGWHLLATQGASVPKYAAWVDKWSLLDLFLVLIISVAVARLWSWKWGLLFFSALILIYHTPNAPRLVFISLIITTALIRLLRDKAPAEKTPDKKDLKTIFVYSWHAIALIFLACVTIAFVYIQVRTAIYPQLSRPYYQSSPHDYETTNMAPQSTMAKVKKKTRALKSDMEAEVVMDVVSAPEPSYYLRPDQQAATQTGPGLPSWKWNTVPINMGLVTGDHPVTFWLMSPLQNSIISIVRAILLLVLLFRFIQVRFKDSIQKKQWIVQPLALLMVMGAAQMPPDADAASYPSQNMLKELKSRLLEPAPCYPDCASISTAIISIPQGQSGPTITQEIHAATKAAIPLPNGNSTWEPTRIRLNNKPVTAVLKTRKQLWILVPEGVHTLSVSGEVKQIPVRLSFPLSPGDVSVSAPGWQVNGINKNRRVTHELKLSKKEKKQTPAPGVKDRFFSDTASNLEDYLTITRQIHMGLEWKMVTTVERFMRTSHPRTITASIPMLTGEMVQTQNLKIKDSQIQLTLPANQNRRQWESALPIEKTISLNVSPSAPWTEIWHVKADAIWHIDATGLPVVYPDHTRGSRWYPRPGETLTLNVARLRAAGGESLTVDSVNLKYQVGSDISRLNMQANIRTSQGGRHPITGPEGAKVKSIKLNGRTVPPAMQDGQLMIPLAPGQQQVDIEWTQKKGGFPDTIQALLKPWQTKLPEVNLHTDVTNIDIKMVLPHKTWLLFTHGPMLGPAVLLWGYLIVAIIGAFILGRFMPVPVKTRHWLLLGLGMVPLHPASIVLIVLWFGAVHLREKRPPKNPNAFNLTQVGLVFWTVIATTTLYAAVHQGLLGVPDMQVSGNGSSQYTLHWTLDRSGGLLPQPWLIAWSIYAYRLLMFAWALWLAWQVVTWAKWSISAFRTDGMWREFPKPKRPDSGMVRHRPTPHERPVDAEKPTASETTPTE